MWIVENVIKKEEKIWFTTAEYNSLNCIDLSNNKLLFQSVIPGENLLGERLFYEMYCVNRKLILLPYKAHHITIFDTEKKSFQIVDVNITQMISCIEKKMIYATALLDNGKEAIISFNLINNEFCIESIIPDEYKDNDYKSGLCAHISFIQDVLIFSPGGANIIIKYYVKSKKFDVINLRRCEKIYSVIVHHEIIVAMAFHHPIGYLLDLDGNIRATFKLLYKNKYQDNLYYSFNVKKEKVYVCNIINGEIFIVDTMNTGDFNVRSEILLGDYGLVLGNNDDMIMSPSVSIREWRTLDGNNIPYKNNVPLEVINEYFDKFKISVESNTINLNCFLKKVTTN